MQIGHFAGNVYSAGSWPLGHRPHSFLFVRLLAVQVSRSLGCALIANHHMSHRVLAKAREVRSRIVTPHGDQMIRSSMWLRAMTLSTFRLSPSACTRGLRPNDLSLHMFCTPFGLSKASTPSASHPLAISFRYLSGVEIRNNSRIARLYLCPSHSLHRLCLLQL